MRQTLLIAAAIVAAWPAAAASVDRIKFLEGPAAAASLTPEQLAAEVKGYLTPDVVDVSAAILPPPAIDSAKDKTDVTLMKSANAGANPARWQRALEDDATVYDRFAAALGVPPDRAHTPQLVRLLNRVEEDVLAATGEAKKRYPRPRPFQRFQLTRVCGQATAPKPEASPTTGTSYPSGHAAVSWAAALVMMETRPDQATPLIMRAVDYGQSRVVCGVHYPSDIDAGHTVAIAVIDKLFTLPEFRRDLLCAKREVKAVLAGEKSEDLPACQ